MKKLLFILSLLLFSSTTIAGKLREYKEEDIIKTSDFTATTKDGKPLTGSVVKLIDSSKLSDVASFNKIIQNYRDGDLKEQLFSFDKTLQIEKKYESRKLLYLKEYYRNGNIRRETFTQPNFTGRTYNKNGIKIMETVSFGEMKTNTKYYNNKGTLIAETNLYEDNPYVICVAKDGTKKNMIKEQWEGFETELKKMEIDSEYQPDFRCE